MIPKVKLYIFENGPWCLAMSIFGTCARHSIIASHGLGTSQSAEERAIAAGYAGINPALLKHRGDLILVPQPSDSPNDLLNWSKTRKAVLSCLIMYSVALVGGMRLFHIFFKHLMCMTLELTLFLL